MVVERKTPLADVVGDGATFALWIALACVEEAVLLCVVGLVDGPHAGKTSTVARARNAQKEQHDVLEKPRRVE